MVSLVLLYLQTHSDVIKITHTQTSVQLSGRGCGSDVSLSISLFGQIKCTRQQLKMMSLSHSCLDHSALHSHTVHVWVRGSSEVRSLSVSHPLILSSLKTHGDSVHRAESNGLDHVAHTHTHTCIWAACPNSSCRESCAGESGNKNGNERKVGMLSLQHHHK